MSEPSQHLEKIIGKHNRTANLQVVFVDIEKYSRRRSLMQIEVIDRFTGILKNALIETSKQYLDYAQNNNSNFQTDVIAIPTGDGAAFVFSFDGLADIHLSFAKKLLSLIHQANTTNECERFETQGWCNCHPNFFLRVGISEGKGIIFKDVNGNYNVAGEVMNMASRVMGLGDRNHVIFTDESFRNIIDMVDDANLVDRFLDYQDVDVKHGVKLDIHQYVGEGEEGEYINSKPPQDLTRRVKTATALQRLRSLGFPFPNLNSTTEKIDPDKMVSLLENMANVLSGTDGKEAIETTAVDPEKKSPE